MGCRLGIAIGAVPTTSKCVALAVDFLLDHPEHLAEALDGDEQLANGYMNEVLRFNPFGPVLLRTCTAEHRLARGKLRTRKIKRGTTVAVSTLSAMWDGADRGRTRRATTSDESRAATESPRRTDHSPSVCE
jgi:cytochrome P450